MSGARPLSQEEIDLVLEEGFDGTSFMVLRNQTLFLLGLTTGFRISELLSLTVEDVQNPDGSLKDSIEVKKSKMKGKLVSRSTPLLDKVRPYLQRLCMVTTLERNTYLFNSRQRDAAIDPSQAWRVLSGAFNKVKVFETKGTHALRKTFAKRVYEATQKNIYETQKALGHKSIDSTTHYLSFDREELNQKIKQLF